MNGFISSLPVFFQNNVMYEAECEPQSNCDNDQQSFKAYLARWMAGTTLLAPWTTNTIMSYLTPSAEGAAAQCDGGTSGSVCGLHWTAGATYDGLYGPGEQMAAMQVIQSLLISGRPAPLTMSTGGTSESDPTAGAGSGSGGSGSSSSALGQHSISTGDKVGAAILTVVVLVVLIAGAVWTVL